MSKKSIYKITILGWDKHNGKKKKGHTHVLISTNFLMDAKVSTLPIGGKLLYLGLILRCGEVCSSSIEASHDLLVTFAGGSGQVVSRLLDQLQQLQLLSYEKFEPFNIRIEKNRIEKNRKEVQVDLEFPSPPDDQRSVPRNNHKLFDLWNEFCGNLPPAKKLNPSRLRKIKSVYEKISEAEWIEVIKKLAESDFCNGSNDRGWRADFDFLLKPDTWSRALEGRYDNRKKQGEIFMTPAMQRAANNTRMIRHLEELEKKEKETNDEEPDFEALV